MTAYVRPWVLLVALGWPVFASTTRAEHDWRCEIVCPSPWDWLPEAAFLPSLGVHRIERGR